MPSTHPDIALSATETETLRDLRSRLNRLPPSVAARRVLVGAFFKACARVGLAGGTTADGAVTPASVIAGAEGADLNGLLALMEALAALDRARPEEATATIFGGAGQAILTRRLVLAGREQPRQLGAA